MNIKHFIKLSCLLTSILALLSCSSEKKLVVQTKIVKDTVYIKPNPKLNNYQMITSASLPNYVVSEKYFPSQSQDYRVKFLVMHYTVSNYEVSIRALTQKDVSSHYLISDKPNDSIELLVSEDRRAYHAGYSYWNGRESLNDTSIGIEIVNKGYTLVKDSMIFEPFKEFQIKKVAALAKDIIDRYEIDPTHVVGHADIAPQRKQDPGPLFPWKRLYTQYGIGAWYDQMDKMAFIEQYWQDPYKYSDVMEFQKALKRYGYEVKLTGTLDKETQKVIRAFQWHFRPEKTDGNIDAESWAILQALNKKYRSK